MFFFFFSFPHYCSVIAHTVSTESKSVLPSDWNLSACRTLSVLSCNKEIVDSIPGAGITNSDSEQWARTEQYKKKNPMIWNEGNNSWNVKLSKCKQVGLTIKLLELATCLHSITLSRKRIHSKKKKGVMENILHRQKRIKSVSKRSLCFFSFVVCNFYHFVQPIVLK